MREYLADAGTGRDRLSAEVRSRTSILSVLRDVAAATALKGRQAQVAEMLTLFRFPWLSQSQIEALKGSQNGKIYALRVLLLLFTRQVIGLLSQMKVLESDKSINLSSANLWGEINNNINRTFHSPKSPVPTDF